MAAYVRLLGSPAVRHEESWLELPALKTSAILYYLAYQHTWVSRADLLYLLWPDTDEHKARRNLRQLLTKLRRLSYTEALETEGTRLRWPVTTDVQGFNQAVAERRWPQAAQLFEGELLRGFRLFEAPEFESWLELERAELYDIWREAVLGFAEELQGTQRYAESAELLERLHRADPLDETALRHYLGALYLRGERHEALEAFASFRQRLLHDLDGEPESATLQLLERIKKGEPLEPKAANVAVQTIREGSKRQGQPMPLQAIPFVGRNREKAKLASGLADPTCRLVSIVGPGGIGKTRLAIEVATEHQGAFRDGVFFVPFETVAAAEFMVPSLASALDFTFFGSQDPKEQLLYYVQDKEMLLVLDNLEHLLAGVSLLAEVIATAPQVKLLATSRARLNLQAEWLFDLEGLPFPNQDDVDDLQDYDAIQLFIQTAKKVQADFALNEATQEVARICRLVGGMPLAIEVAAGWLRILSVKDIAHEIAQGLDLLKATAQDIPARHRSVRAVFDHSWALLSQKEQMALKSLSVFHGGFTKEAAKEVAEVGLPLLLALSNKSFLRRELSGRFTQHPLIWQYLREKASADGAAQSQARHAAYFATFLREREVLLQGLKAKPVREEIGRELANIREAWLWAVAQQREDLIGQAAEGLYLFFCDEGRYHECEALFAHAAKGITSRSVIHGRVLCLLGGCYNLLRNYLQGAQALQQSLSVLEAHEAPRDKALALLILGSCHTFTNYPLEEVTALWRRCAELFRESGDLAHEGEALGLLAEYTRDPVSAEQQFEDSVRLFKSSGKCFGMLGGITLALSNFAQFAAHTQGAYQRAVDLNGEALQIERALGETYRTAWYLNFQAEFLIYQGNYREAEQLFSEAQLIGEALESGWGDLEADRALYGLGWLTHLRGEPDKAKHHLSRVLDQTQLHGDAFGTGARAMDTLGCVALAEGNLDEAADLCQEALRFFSSLNPQRSGRDWGKARCLMNLGDIALAQGNIRAAQGFLYEALAIAREWRLIPVALHLCVGFAHLFQCQGNEQRAARLLDIAISHPAAMFETREAAKRELGAVPIAVVEARLERALALEEVVEELLSS